MTPHLAVHHPQTLHAGRILAVDDDRSLLAMLQSRLETKGYHVLTARNGDEAFSIIERERDTLDAVLLDRQMPGLGGLQVVQMVKSIPGLSHIPVIMQTAADRPEQIQEGIQAGVFYYLTKPLQPAVMESVLTSAVDESRRLRAARDELDRQDIGYQLLESARFEIRTLDHAQSLGTFLARCFPEPKRVVAGLLELMTNAIEHGNLGITYDEKTLLLDKGRWEEELRHRLTMERYAAKTAEVIYKRRDDGCYVQITDQGEGFDWRSFMTIDPARATDNHGRGIAQANHLAFDRLKYNEKGNQVVAVSLFANGQQPSIDW